MGLDPLRDVLDYLGPRLEAALAELNCTLKPSRKMLAGTLLRAAADFCASTKTRGRRRCGSSVGESEGDPLDCLIAERRSNPRRR